MITLVVRGFFFTGQALIAHTVIDKFPRSEMISLFDIVQVEISYFLGMIGSVIEGSFDT